MKNQTIHKISVIAVILTLFILPYLVVRDRLNTNRNYGKYVNGASVGILQSTNNQQDSSTTTQKWSVCLGQNIK